MTFATHILSKAGGRESQQDSCGEFSERGVSCWVVADGLGGHRGGEVASRIALDTVLESFRRRPEVSGEAIEQHIRAAHEAIVERQSREAELCQMRTTVVLLVADMDSFLWGHAGDSRLYYFRAGSLLRQTLDHSVPQAMALAGEIASAQIRFHPDRNRLLRCLGEKGAVRPAILAETGTLSPGDAFLLCTDGFWELVTEPELAGDLADSRTPAGWLEKAEARLLARAPAEHDNYSAIAVFHGTPARRRPWDKLRRLTRLARPNDPAAGVAPPPQGPPFSKLEGEAS